MNAHAQTPIDRSDLAGFVTEIERFETIFASWDDARRATVVAYKRSIEALNAEALRRLIRSLKTDPVTLDALKSAVADEVVYAVLRRHEIVKPSLAERVERAIEGIRPMLALHGGDVELVKIAAPVVDVRFTGACDGCPASALTFHAGVKKAIQDACPEISEIHQVKGLGGSSAAGISFISPFAHGAEGGWLYAASLTDIPENAVRAMELGGEKVLLWRQGAVVTCFQNACAHLGLPIDAGEIVGGILTCPHHEFQYELTSGECLTAPEVQLQSHAVRIVGRRVEVRLSK